MALVMTPIYTRVLDNNNTTTVTFNNIPQIFTDLKLVASVRDSAPGTAIVSQFLFFNGSNAGGLVSVTRAFFNVPGTPQSSRTTNADNSFPFPVVTGATATANTFANVECYIPNYTSNNFKQLVVEGVTENNSAANFAVHLDLAAVLYRSTNPITALSINCSTTFVQHSSFSLYGIIRSGA